MTATSTSTSAQDSAEEPPDSDAVPPVRRRSFDRLVVGGLTAVVAGLPLAVALGVLRSPRWFPLLDLAQTELRVRDVGTGDRPLVGLAGRFTVPGHQGSHLGPISFYALWPFYMVFGFSAWALQAAAATLNILATGTAIWIGKRRGGPVLALAVAAGMVVLMRAYGADKLTEAWNPYMPMLWWIVFLLAVWSVLSDDLPLLPVAAVAGTFCVQTHIPYLGIVGGIGAFLVLAVAASTALRWRQGRMGRPYVQRLMGWGGLSLVLLVGLWLPPVIEQTTNDPGNMTIVRQSFGTSEDERPGVGRAVSVWLDHLNPVAMVVAPETGDTPRDGSVLGAVTLAVWAGAAGVTAWSRVRRWGDHWWQDVRLLHLHLVVGAALVLGLISISRIHGALWWYLMLWAWGTTILLLLATGWTVTNLVRSRSPERTGPRTGALAVRALAAFTLVAAVGFTYEATSTRMPAAHESAMVAELAPRTMDALRSGDLPGGGEDGRYLVRWAHDTLGIGGQGYGMFLELERQGFTVGAPEPHATGVVPHRVLAPEEATAALHYVVGEDGIERWRDTPDAVLVVEGDLRTPEERARFDQLHDEATEMLQEAGEDDLLDLLDRNVFMTTVSLMEAEHLPEDLHDKVAEMVDLGAPAAVFLTPPDLVYPQPES